MKTILYLAGLYVVSTGLMAAQPAPDTPIPFGYKMSWYAVRSTNCQAVADALKLQGQQPANWQEGFKNAYGEGGAVFVSPPISGWTFVIGSPVFPDLKPAEQERCLARLKTLSEKFGEAQLFATHRGVSSHAWARAEGGKLLRAFGYNGDEGRDVWNVGEKSKDESELKLNFSAEKQPDEEDVMKLAGRWSVNPQQIDKLHVPPAVGIVGKL